MISLSIKKGCQKEKFKDDAEANALLGRPMLNEWAIKL